MRTVSLKTKINGIILLTIILLTTLWGIVYLKDQVAETKKQEDRFMAESVKSASDMAAMLLPHLVDNDFTSMHELVSHYQKHAYHVYVSIVDAQNRIMAQSGGMDLGSTLELPAPYETNTIGDGTARRYIKAGKEYFDISYPIQAGDLVLGSVRIGLNADWLREGRSRLRKTIIVFLAASVMIIMSGILASSWVVNKVVMPLLLLKQAADKIGTGDYDQSVKVRSTDEVGKLARSFNKMVEDLKSARAQVGERNAELTTLNEQLRNLSVHLQNVREDERTRIAREIHDELGQLMTALKLELSLLGKKIQEDQIPLTDKIESMAEIIDTSIQTVKRISTDLRPGILDHLGLAEAVKWQAKEFEKRTGIRCDVAFEPEEIVLDRNRSTTLFRVFQEALTNVARHSKASKVGVFLKRQADEIHFQISDDGKGITKDQLSDMKSLGLIGMRERVRYWGGMLTIQGTCAKGTTVIVRIPCDSVAEMQEREQG